MVNVACSTYGGLDLAHNNAGIVVPAKRFEGYPLKSCDHIIRNNLSTFFSR